MFDSPRWRLLDIGVWLVLGVLMLFTFRTDILLSVVSVGVGLLMGVTVAVYLDGFSETYREADARTVLAVVFGAIGTVVLVGSAVSSSSVALGAFIHGLVACALATKTTEFVLAESGLPLQQL